jgi:electron transfer flavoprotein beta subunit
MKIILCVKQVPDTTDIKWTENNTIRREGLESVFNPYDVYALESALELKREYINVNITTVTMGPKQAENVLRRSISLGADKGVLLCDKKFAGADTYATSKTIATAIKSKLDEYDLILCGQFAVDGDTAQTGPGIANFLNIPQVTYVKKILRYCGDTITVLREIDDGVEEIKVKLPAVLCMLKDDYETTRATINGIRKAQKSDITTYSADDIGLNAEEVGLKGSPTYVSRAFRAEKKQVACNFMNDTKELANIINVCRRNDE